MRATFFFILTLFCFTIIPRENVYAQEKDIIPYLKQIERGNKQIVEKEIPILQIKYPKDPSILFLKGVVTGEGQTAINIYSDVLNNYPGSRYADASTYRLYAYYYALGNYTKAKDYLDVLKAEYPQSPYLSIAKRNVPDKNSILVTGSHVGNEVIKTTPKSTEEEYKFTIQAGAFSLAGNAESLKKEFTDDGYFSVVEDKLVAGTNFHIVFIGKFVNQDDAKSFLKQINSKYNLNGVVIKLESLSDK